jgi:cytochrome c556
MKRLTRIGMAAALAAVSAMAVAQAVTKAADQAAATKAIEARQALMKEIRDANNPIGAMMRPNGTPVDPAVVAASATKLAGLAAKIPDAFLVDTRGFTATKTAALDGIWNSYPDFKSKADDMVKALTAAADAGKTGNVDATRTAMQGIGRACGGCHTPYRARQQ